MYKNIGGKVKGLAIFIFIALSLLSVIAGVIILNYADTNEALTILGLLYILGGPIFAWASSLTTYGFGVLLDKALDIEYNTREKGTIAVSDRKVVANSFLERGIITEEEYIKVISSMTTNLDEDYYEHTLKNLSESFDKGIISEDVYYEHRKSIIDKLIYKL